jgi:RHS repeat-associated protein
LKSQAPSTTTNPYAWDAEGRLKSVDSGATVYVYNAFGQRVEKQTGSAYTEVVYDAFGSAIGLHNRTGWDTYFVPFGGRPFVRYQDSKTYFLHPNHLGSTTFVTDQTGATIQKTIYYPWGQLWANSTTIKDNRFASMEPRDGETANDPTLFRVYNPRLYRWLSPDPLAGDITNPQSLNRYAYVMNNPMNMIDPLGLEGECGPGRSTCEPGSRYTGLPWVYIWGDPYYWHLHGSFGTNIADPCSYVGYYGAECRQAPGLWPNGDPIFSWLSVGGIGGGDITGWNPNSPPINLPPPSSPAPYSRCDWGSCTGPEWSQIGNSFEKRNPDYYQVTLNFNPFLFGWFGFSGTFSIDRHGRIYVTPGVNFGKGWPGFGASMTYGWMKGYEGTQPPRPEQLGSFLKGSSCSAGVGALWVGKTAEWSAGGRGTSDPILMTPQIGASCGYTFASPW